MALNDLNIPSLKGSNITSSERLRGGQGQWDIDPDTDIDMSIGDPHYQTCLKVARELKAKYPLEGLSKDALVEREATVVARMTEKIHEVYGDYNTAIANGADSSTHPSMHKDSALADDGNPNTYAKLQNFEKGSLICRHYAPLTCSLLDAAGVPTLYVSGISHNHEIGNDGQFIHTKSKLFDDFDYHAWLVSRLTGNVIETTNGGEHAYKRNLNGPSVEDAVAGKTIFTSSGINNYSSYGSGFSGGAEHERVLAERTKKIAAGDFAALPTVNQDGTTKESRRDAEKAYEEGEVRSLHQARKPFMDRFDDIVKNGAADKDLADLKQAHSVIHFPPSKLATALNTADEHQQIQTANWLIDQGALKGYKGSVDAKELLYWKKSGAINPDYCTFLSRKAGVSAEEYFDKAVENKWLDHMKVALSRIEQESPKTERLRAKLATASFHLKNDFDDPKTPNTKESFRNIAEPIDNFLASHQSWNGTEKQPATPSKPTLASNPEGDKGFSFSGAAIGAAVLGAINMLLGGGWMGGIITLLIGGAAGGLLAEKFFGNTPDPSPVVPNNATTMNVKKEPSVQMELTAPFKNMARQEVQTRNV